MKRFVHLLLSFLYMAFVLTVLVLPFILKKDKPLPRKSQAMHRIRNGDLQRKMIEVHPIITSFQNYQN